MFINNKYTKWYYQIIDNARNRITDEYVETHHILPKSMGGDNSENNLIKLTAREHFVCHLILIKMTHNEDRNKMSRAFWLMAKGTGKRYRPSSRLYEMARKSFVIAQTGHPNYLKKQSEESRNKISITMKKRLSELTSEEQSTRIKKSCSSSSSWTEDRKKKISRALTGKILSEETKRKMSKECIFVSPNGDEYFHHGLKEGCEYHSLNYGSVKNNVSKNKMYRGWKIVYD